MADLNGQIDMQSVYVIIAAIVRLLRPSDGLHNDPCGYFRAVVEELRRRRSSRVRRYAAAPVSAVVREVPPIPAPRRPLDSVPALPARTLREVPADYVHIVDPRAVEPQAAMVRPGYRAHERRVEQLAADRTRRGLAVLADIAHAAQNAEVAR